MLAKSMNVMTMVIASTIVATATRDMPIPMINAVPAFLPVVALD